MLAYILAITVAIGSFSFYMAAFFVPEMHRRQDFFWSGLGMFYAVVLWFCAGRLTGAVLLGQLVSVVLLGGLGWHTLALRRDLTPELVQTPVAWEDVQKLTQDLQRLVRQYARLDDLASLTQSTWDSVTQLVANWRDRAATVPSPEAVADVPPLKRSPAYEFETAPGDGQAVPTEFATVASRQRPQPALAETLESPIMDEAAADAESSETAVSSGDTDRVTPSPVESTPSADDTTDASDVIDEATTQAVSTTPKPTAESSTATPRQKSTASVSPPPARSQTVAQTGQESSTRQSNPVAGAINWAGNLIGGGRKPKPQRGVIEIPPRPPSIPRDPNAAPTPSQSSKPTPQKSRPGKASRAVIDIPPRPPSIPRSPKPPSAPSTSGSVPPVQSTVEAETNWVDVGDTNPSAAKRPTESSASENQTTPPPTAPTSDEANWPEPKTNWPTGEAETTTRRDSSSPPDSTAAPADDTNWPDDGDTNWPD
ncbi:Ycf66 family protein [Leptolyngbya iicbica]|uniref:Ycf66 family protein n=2 Tax=Cyanophyceae TaxID=3028117 RepID=A0A4Q7EAB6_9CYAN|nr:Ycf66 family protein [Leptolyngbya sp. LK]RZM79463.1 hypothetical protein DYY88_12050 [Leptolyngbya sp. LK]